MRVFKNFILILYRLEADLNKKVCKKKHITINKLVDVTVNQEILNLEKMMDSLRTKLNVVEKAFEKQDVGEMSKFWSEMLLETKVFVDFLFESYRDISTKIISDYRERSVTILFFRSST